MKNLALLLVLPVTLILSLQTGYSKSMLKADYTSNYPISGRIYKSTLNSIQQDYTAIRSDSLIEKIEYSAQGSTSLNKDRSILSLYGKAKFSCRNFYITGDEIIYNKITQKIIAKNFTITNNSTKVKKNGNYGEFNLNDKRQ